MSYVGGVYLAAFLNISLQQARLLLSGSWGWNRNGMGFALIDTMFLSAKDVNVSKIPMGFFPILFCPLFCYEACHMSTLSLSLWVEQVTLAM